MIQIAMAGAGAAGMRYTQHLLKTGQAQIAGIFDETQEAAAELAAHCGCSVFASLEALLEAVPEGVVFVCSRQPENKARHVIQALQQGRHVIAELPAASRLQDVRDMLAAAGPSAKRLLFTNPERFYFHNADVKKRIAGGAIGSIGMINAKRYSPLPSEHADSISYGAASDDSVSLSPAIQPGANQAAWTDSIRWSNGQQEPEGQEAPAGALYRLALSDIGHLRWIAGDVASVYAMRTVAEGLDYVLVTLKFQCGAIANIEAYWGYPGGYVSAAEYAGPKGVIRYDSRKTNALSIHKTGHAGAHAQAKHQSSPSFRDPEVAEFTHLLSCITDSQQPVSTAADVLETLKVTDAALQSIRSGQPVEMAAFAAADQLDDGKGDGERA
ncbi:Gfo/Idh/MocA family protein [Paenibacillus thalictri]|nr:Gfo/Idh/MocA family oxidoreductase [Paenibacillus thalictri]